MNQAYRGGDPIAEVVRSNFVEGFHRGSAVVLGAAGTVLDSVGDIESPIYPRSSSKPMQALGALRSGLSFDDPADLAMATASHRGEPFHIARVRSMLQDAGLTPRALECPVSLPTDPDARDAVVAAGGGATRLLMNCSGKHAGMLATCVAAGWPTSDYLDPRHPLQLAARQAISDASGYRLDEPGVDGCGAPLYAFPLLGLARAFQRFVDAEPGSDERLVADAMRAHPELVSGTRGEDTVLMRAVPGLLSKGGAEGVAALALPGVGAVAVKVDDGNARAAFPVAVAALRSLDLSRLDIDEPTLNEHSRTTVWGGGRAVGEVRPVWPPA